MSKKAKNKVSGLHSVLSIYPVQDLPIIVQKNGVIRLNPAYNSKKTTKKN